MIYLRLFYEFAKAGLFAIGGGMATIPFLLDMGQRTGWFTAQNVADMLAISESTPGPIGVNMATYVGYQCKGIPGGVVATLGLIFPSIVIILIVAAFLEKFRTNKTVDGAFQGIRPASLGLIGAALLRVWQLTFLPRLGQQTEAASSLLEKALHAFDFRTVVLAILLFVLTKKTKWHPIVYIGLAAVVGALIFPLIG